MPKRKPKYQGTGLNVNDQIFKDLVKGDTFFDSDLGFVRWTGKKWKQDDEAYVEFAIKQTRKRMGGK